MTLAYPNDADGEALRRIAGDGNDMSAPMEIEFPVVVPDKSAARQFASSVRGRGYRAQLWQHDDDADWDVVCTITMVPTYDDIVRMQRELTALAEPFSGYCDGWGTLGNAGN